jgi:alpha-D-ribose 1-methylphosphonate 5-triphosphate diphosphatase
MGAPNVVRGGSHSGNVAASRLADAGLLDILSSDYVPASLLLGAFQLADCPGIAGLPGAINLVSRTPALALGLNDRGEIAPGKRADLIRVGMMGDQPVIREVWRMGRRVA